MSAPEPRGEKDHPDITDSCMTEDKIPEDNSAKPVVNRAVFKANLNSLVREEVFEGQAHYVFPAVLAVEGVMNGLMYTRSELSKLPETWNGRVVTFKHPEIDGMPVSANSPDIMEKFGVGILFNVFYDHPKLRGEVYLNKAKVESSFPEILAYVNGSGAIMEVSTGLFTEVEAEEGFFNNEPYYGIARNITSDHFALLLDETGASSVADGAGAPRINSAEEKEGFIKGIMNRLDSFLTRHEDSPVEDINNNKEVEPMSEPQVEDAPVEETVVVNEEVQSEVVTEEVEATEEVVVNEEVVEVKPEEQAVEQAKEVLTFNSLEDILGAIEDSELKKSVEQGVAMFNAVKSEMVEKIIAIKTNKFDKEALESKTYEELDCLVALIGNSEAPVEVVEEVVEEKVEEKVEAPVANADMTAVAVGEPSSDKVEGLAVRPLFSK